ncbi:hypothetical protein HBH51_239760 [Parastagonospora nodorum]|nr:hypothetical protein HBH51_239760 [Parastagonospora nodorum]
MRRRFEAGDNSAILETPTAQAVKALGWRQVSCAEGSTVGSRRIGERDRRTVVQVQILSSS